MDLRIFVEPQQGATYDDQLRVAKAAEELGFDAFFRSDHYMAFDGDGLPGPTDAWLTLAALARETTRIRLGTLVTPVTFRYPGPLAISVAQVDEMRRARRSRASGRVVRRRRTAAYGIPFPDVAERFDILAEQVEIIDGLWRTPVGETYSFDLHSTNSRPPPALPKPVQSPRPIILGGAAKRRGGRARGSLCRRVQRRFRLAGTGAAFDRWVGRSVADRSRARIPRPTCCA